MQSYLMVLMGAVCLISALDWARNGQYGDALAFGAFGIGYFGLASVFVGA